MFLYLYEKQEKQLVQTHTLFPMLEAVWGKPRLGWKLGQCVQLFSSKSRRVSNKVSCSGWKSAAAETEWLFPVCVTCSQSIWVRFAVKWDSLDLFLFVLLVLISFEGNLSVNQSSFWREILPLVQTNNITAAGGLTRWQEVTIKSCAFLLHIKSFKSTIYLLFISAVNSGSC